jgi:hypothetical protein
MHIARIQRAITRVALITVAALSFASVARAADDNRAPELPAVCQSGPQNIQAPEGHKVARHVYAVGVQVYRWNGAAWDFVGPVASLFSDHNFRGQVGTHYGGPTWEGNNGGKVVARRVSGCTPDASAIPWLLLEATSNDGVGIFSRVTFIQRVNTVGGLAPAAPGAFVNEERKVPYTTEYVFYRAEN